MWTEKKNEKSPLNLRTELSLEHRSLSNEKFYLVGNLCKRRWHRIAER